ncbi:MAG: hypothetical protein L3J69_06360 [Desulfobacula sp.]|nr:hypothetical protein [Desulfobacula sp.]
MKFFVVTFTTAFLLLTNSLLFSNEFDPETMSKDLHYSGKYCSQCHTKTPKVNGSNKYLKFNGNLNLLCNCHFYTAPSYIHPVDIKPDEKIKKIPPSFPLKNGKLACSTCHDIYLQCRKSKFKKNSLRGAPYKTRYEVCYLCHNSREYKMLNPHKQLDENNKIITQRCLYCHLEKPDENYSLNRDIILKNNIEVLCQRCHNIKGNHSGNVNHLRIPSSKAVKRMNAMKNKFNIILPLDNNGKLTCATCHNPHENGVIRANKPSSKGADSNFRLRLPGKMCTECHQI